jgi:four helix bundle protein
LLSQGGRMQNFRNLKVWEKGHHLTLAAYVVTRAFPKDETYGLTSQIRRGCASIGANIAEGCGRMSDAEMARFLYMAMGSASEVEYHFLLARDLGLIRAGEYIPLHSQVVEVKRMLAALLSKLKAES